jgi:hypothetical protein
VVGTALTLINRGESLLRGPPGMGLIARIALTYLVPFLVSLYAMRGTIPDLRTGQRSARGGPYRCRAASDHADLARLAPGQLLPPCPTCGRGARWVPLEG